MNRTGDLNGANGANGSAAGAETIQFARAMTGRRAPLADVLARPGTRTVLLAGSRDPNAKITLILLDDYGPAFVVKVPTTRQAAQVVRNEGYLLQALRDMPLGRLATTLPQPIGYLDADGLAAMVTNAIPGTPMTVRYHAWRHTARRRRVRADFGAASTWLADLQSRTAGRPAAVTLLGDSLDEIRSRFPDHPDLGRLRRTLGTAAARLAAYRTPRTVVHGDYWFGNLLLGRDSVVGVVDWESGATAGEPLRDVARFAVSYALYLDRHTRPGCRVAGHRGLRADAWGAGLAYAAAGTGWFPTLVRTYLGAALDRLGLPGGLAPDVLLAGIADVAATADHPDFACHHVDLLARIMPADGAAAGRATTASHAGTAWSPPDRTGAGVPPRGLPMSLSAAAGRATVGRVDPSAPGRVDPSVAARVDTSAPGRLDPSVAARVDTSVPARVDPSAPARVDPSVAARAEPPLAVRPEPHAAGSGRIVPAEGPVPGRLTPTGRASVPPRPADTVTGPGASGRPEELSGRRDERSGPA